jgi:hypothetical protein
MLAGGIPRFKRCFLEFSGGHNIRTGLRDSRSLCPANQPVCAPHDCSPNVCRSPTARDRDTVPEDPTNHNSAEHAMAYPDCSIPNRETRMPAMDSRISLPSPCQWAFGNRSMSASGGRRRVLVGRVERGGWRGFWGAAQPGVRCLHRLPMRREAAWGGEPGLPHGMTSAWELGVLVFGVLGGGACSHSDKPGGSSPRARLFRPPPGPLPQSPGIC